MAKIEIPTVNQKLLNKYVRHSVYLEQLKKGEARRISLFLKQNTFPKIYSKLVGELSKVKNLETLGSIRKIKRLKKMLAATHKISVAGAVKAEKQLIGRLVNVAKFESQWNADVISKTVPLDIDMTMPSNEVLKQLVTVKPFDGHKLQTWMKGYSKAVQVSMFKQIKGGVATGESLPEIGRRINKALNWKGKQAEYIARTAVSSVVHNAREEVFKQNKDIVRKVQWVATLDDRTSLMCINLDGKMFSPGEGMRPPAHFNCRSSVIPVTPSWQEFGVVDPPPATRASMNGAVPAKLTYKQWLKKQPKAVQIKVLGKRRANLYRTGRVKIDRFVGRDLRPLTLKQLARRERIKFQELKVPTKIKAMSIKSVGKLTSVDKNAFNGWSWYNPEYADITRIQRGLKPEFVKKSVVLKAEKRLATALEKLDGFSGTTYRGMIFDSAAKRASFLKQFKSGGVYKSKTFLATSKSEVAIRKITKQKNSLTMVIKGQSGRDISKYAALPGEKEVLFMKGAPFKVDKVVGNKVYLSEITKQAQLKVKAPTKIKAMPVRKSGLEFTSVDEKVLYNYSDTTYKNIVRAQLGKPLEKRFKLKTKLEALTETKKVEKALLKLDGHKGLSYRGLSFGSEAERSKFLSQFKKGNVWKSKSFQSTSRSKKEIQFFLGRELDPYDVTLHIKGISGRDIAKYSPNPNELETLFMKGTSFKVDKIIGNKVYLTEVTKQAQLAVKPLKGVSFKGVHADYQLVLDLRLAELTKKFPKAKVKFDGVKLFSGSQYKRKFGDSFAIVMREEKKEIINLNGKYWGAKSKLDMNLGVSRMHRKHWLVAEKADDLLTHEFGHIVQNSLPQQRIWDVSNFWWDMTPAIKNQVGKQISKYALESPFELFAESFTQWQMGKASPMAKKIIKMSGLKL